MKFRKIWFSRYQPQNNILTIPALNLSIRCSWRLLGTWFDLRTLVASKKSRLPPFVGWTEFAFKMCHIGIFPQNSRFFERILNLAGVPTVPTTVWESFVWVHRALQNPSAVFRTASEAYWKNSIFIVFSSIFQSKCLYFGWKRAK